MADKDKAAAGVNIAVPKSQVRRIMKLNDSVTNVSADTVVSMSRATELFITYLAELSCKQVSGSRKTLKLEDILNAISDEPHKLQFLDGVLQPIIEK